MALALAVLLMLYISACFVGCSRINEKEARSMIEGYFEIEVPQEAKVVYYYYQIWQEATGYAVFIFEKEPTDWLNNSKLLKEKDEEFESRAKETVDRYFEFSKQAKPEDTGFLGSGLTVLPEEYIPDFEKEYWWREEKRGGYKTDRIALIYVPEKLMLVFYIKTWL